jgi:phenylpyruvate tautomerase PptA (4-oxalocrotonate tautomerase family)
MPLLNLLTSALPDPAERAPLLASLSSLLARELGKPERYVMVALDGCSDMCFAGTRAPACYVEVKNVGTLSAEDAERLSNVLCAALSRGLNVPADRIYIEFTNVDGALWGWNGGTFA